MYEHKQALTPAQGKVGTDTYMENKSWNAEALFQQIPGCSRICTFYFDLSGIN